MWVSAGSIEDLPANRCVAVDGGGAVVVRVEGGAVAFANRCLHQDSPLAGGMILDGRLICPLHFWRYRLPSGEHIGSGARLPNYPTKMEGGELWVEVPEPEPPMGMRERLLRHAEEWKARRPVGAVIWDMGGIFRRYFTEPMVEIGRARGWPLERIPLGPTGLVADPDYWAMAEGEIEESEYLHRILERLDAEGISFDPRRDVDWRAHERPATWETIARLHQAGIPQVILTNDASRWMGERWWETWEPAHFFKAVVDVATLDQRKPEPGPYLEAILRAGVPAAACVFVDDMPVNCRGAEAVGMRSVWFDITRPEAAIAALLEMAGLRP
jgi:HAD superfamily hydrolase (TIGR01509 family)